MGAELRVSTTFVHIDLGMGILKQIFGLKIRSWVYKESASLDS